MTSEDEENQVFLDYQDPKNGLLSLSYTHPETFDFADCDIQKVSDKGRQFSSLYIFWCSYIETPVLDNEYRYSHLVQAFRVL